MYPKLDGCTIVKGMSAMFHQILNQDLKKESFFSRAFVWVTYKVSILRYYITCPF